MNGRELMTALLLILTGICTLTDLRDGRIYNVVLVPAAIVGLILRGLPMCGGSWVAVLSALARMGVVLLAFLPVWALFPGGIGGGDIKLYAVIAILVEGRILLILICLSLAVAAGYGIFLRIRSGRGRRMRIGPAVLCATVLYVGGVYG